MNIILSFRLFRQFRPLCYSIHLEPYHNLRYKPKSTKKVKIMLSEPSVPCSEFRVQGLQPMDLVYDIFFNPEP
jgi:hypothetical protein